MTVPSEHFTTLYAAEQDPYGFVDRWYERRKRALTLAALPQERYRSGFEAGCSIGVLTSALAERCDQLLACDVAEAAVARARDRLARTAHVTVEQRQLPEEWPAGPFDLVVLSEVAYYFADDALAALLAASVHSLEPGGTLLACHWRHAAPYPQSADDVTAAIEAHPSLRRIGSYVDDDMVLTVHVREPPGPLSVAQREGIV